MAVNKIKTKDEIVDDLISIVTKKKAEIAKAERPKWETNCTYVLNGERINIQTVTSLSKLVEIGTDIDNLSNGFATMAISLGVEDTIFKKDGFTAKQWISDLQTRVTRIQISKKKAELEDAEERLNRLISPEKREQMELIALQKLVAKA